MNKLKEFREKLRMSQETIAAKIDVTRSLISAYETGTKKMTLKTATKLAAIFHCSPYELLGADAIKYDGGFIESLNALVDANFDKVIESSLGKSSPDEVMSVRDCDVWSILFGMLKNQFVAEDVKSVLSLVNALAKKYDAAQPASHK